MKEIKEYKEVLKELHKVDSCATGTDRFMARCFPLMIKQNKYLIKLLEKQLKRKRKKSTWNKFISYHMKKGKSIKECSEMWRDKNV